jgi:hypothetical protein
MINIIIDPGVLTDPGGQLSYAATAGIICGAETVNSILSSGSRNKILKIFSATLSVVLMAQLAVLPIQLFHFWQMGLLFLPANLLIEPFVTPITITGFLASLAAILNVPGLALGLTVCQWLDWLAAIPLQIIICVTEKLAAFDFAVLNTGRPILAVIGFYYLLLAVWLICLQKERYRLLSTTFFIFSLLALFYQPPLKRPMIIVLPHAIICINECRQGLYLGSPSRQTNKILAYYATSRGSCQQAIIENNGGQKILAQIVNSHALFLSPVVTDNKPLASSSRTYAVTLGKIGNDRQLMARLSQSQTLSRNEWSRQLQSIDLKICCPGRAIHFYSMEGGATSFNSSVL